MADWQFYLADSATMTNFGPLTPISDTSLTTQVNRGGELKLAIHTRDDFASLVSRVKTCVKAVRNGITVWSGPVWTIQGDLDQRQMQIACQGWQGILEARLVQPSQLTDQPYNAIDGGLIAFNLLDKANAQGLTLPGAPSTTFIRKGTRASTLPSGARTRSYKAWDNIGKEIQALSDIENGFDYEIDPTSRLMNIYYPQIGTDRPLVQFGYQAGPENLSNVTPQADASTIANRFTALGKLTNQYVQDNDYGSQADIGLLEDSGSLSDVSDAGILAAYAASEVAFRTAFTTYNLSPLGGDPSVSDIWIPMLYQDFFLGDTFRFSASEGPYVFNNQPARCFGAEVVVDQNGNEHLNSISTFVSG